MKKHTIALMLLLALSIPVFSMGKKKLKRIMDSYINHPKKDVLFSMGIPTQTASDGDGGEILLYSHAGYLPAYNYGNGISGPSRSWYDCSYFYVNSSGIVYGWRTARENIPPQSIDLTVRRY